jgi:radical SAM protein with 4Fe4S-binding SPASM domain
MLGWQTMQWKIKDIDERPDIVGYPFGLFNIELTNRCPMRCVMCPRTKNMTRKQGFLEFGLFKKAVDELVEVNPDYQQKHPVWLHHFGESLMHKQFGEFIRYIRKKGVYTCLSINPIMLKDDVAIELIDSAPDMLIISFDGHDDESFYKIRGVKNAYKPSLDNILRFVKQKKIFGSSINTVLSMIDFPMNKKSVEKTRSFWESLEGIDSFLLKHFSTWDGGAKDVSNLAQKESFNPSHESREQVHCNFPWEKMTIMWDGDVVPCCYDYNKKFVLGSIKKQSLSEIWNHERMQTLRQEFKSNNVTNPLCRSCDKLRLPRHLWQW